jgi:hypothetical protein
VVQAARAFAAYRLTDFASGGFFEKCSCPPFGTTLLADGMLTRKSTSEIVFISY